MKSIYLSLVFIVSSWAITLTGTHNHLERINWVQSPHQLGGVSKVGGYLRGPSTAYDNETLVKFDLTGISSVEEVKLKFDVVGGLSGGVQTLRVFQQNLNSTWDPSSATYDTFCNTTNDCNTWPFELGTIQANSTTPGQVEFSSAHLKDLVESWIDDPSINQGIILAGGFGSHVYYLEVNNFSLEIVEGSGSSSSSNTSSASGVHETEVAATHYYLKQENWNGTHHQVGGTARLGGYSRYQPFGYESLLDFDLSSSSITGIITDVKLQFHVTGGNNSFWNQIIVYDQNKGDWSPSTVTYDSFDKKAWTKALGITEVGAGATGWQEIRGAALVDEVRSWLEDPTQNKGLVLTGAYWHWGYYVDMDQAKLVIVTKDEGIDGESVESAHGRNYQYSFEKGNLLSNWSFENRGQQWEGSNSDVRVHQKDISSSYCENCLAKSGSYVAEMGNTPEGLKASHIPVKASQEYTLSFYYRGQSDEIKPRVSFANQLTTDELSSMTGAKYSSSTAWRYYEMTFTTDAEAHYVNLALYSNGSVNNNSLLYFDDVILEEGQAKRERQFVGEGISFGDAFGRTHQAQALVNKGTAHSLYVDGCLENYLLHANETISFGKRTISVGGSLGANGDITVGQESKITGSILSGNNLSIGTFATLEGNLKAEGSISVGASGTHNGTTESSASNLPLCDNIQSETVTYGSEDVFLDYDADVTLEPGSYRGLSVISGAAKSRLRMSSGVYYFKSFVLNPDVDLILDLSDGSIEVYVEDNLQLADRTQVLFSKRTGSSFVKWSTNQSNDLILGEDSRLTGVFFAPNAKVSLGSRTILEGGLYAKSIEVGEDGFLGMGSFFLQPSGSRYVVTANTFDAFGRANKSSLPFLGDIIKPQIIADPLDLANAFYDGSKIVEDAEGYAYSEVEYAPGEAGQRVVKSGSAGKDWKLSGSAAPEQGYHFVLDLSIPADLAIAPTNNSLKKYARLTWSLDVNKNYSLTWTNFAGQTIQTAQSTFAFGSWSTSPSDWSITQYEYYPNGSLKQSKTPLDVKNGTTAFSKIVNYNSLGQVTSTYSPDLGLEKYWYTRSGDLRYSQNKAQRASNQYSYIEYDKLGRVIEKGLQTIPSGMTVAKGEVLINHSDVRVRSSEYYYDNADGLFIGGGTPSPSGTRANTRGRLAAKIAFNTQTDLPNLDKKVITMFSYDKLGRVTDMYKYIGAIADPSKRWSRLQYEYDDLKRVTSKSFYESESQSVATTQQNYSYDALHRVVQIKDLDDENIVSFQYDDLGDITDVILAQGVKVSYKKHLKGWTTEIKVIESINNKNIFQQNLGYESKAAHAENASYLGDTRYDGAIKQNLTKLSSDVSGAGVDPVRLQNYDYDHLGRLKQSQGYVASNALDANENFKTNVGFSSNNTNDVAMTYDANGRILTKKLGAADKLLYNYNANSYKLNNVKTANPNSNVFTYNGISRSMYAQDNFVYDDHGRLVYDLSKGLQINYNHDHMAVEMKITADNGYVYSQKFLYDADGKRVSTLHYTQTTDTATTGYTSAKHYVNYGSTNFLEVKEDLQANTVASIPSILGLSSKVGRILPNNQKEFYIKDYQGSTIRTVRSDGSYNDGFSFQYLPFGLKKDLKVPANGEEVTESYTGKELDEMSMTYYFGARFYDPVLGVWLSPDPARQFNDPYGVGGDFVNFVDPDGRFVCGGFCIAAVVVGAAIGGYVGNRIADAKGYDFNDWEMYAYIGGGAVIGGAAGYAGAWAAAPAAAGGTTAATGSAAIGGTGSAATVATTTTATGGAGLGATGGIIASSTVSSAGFYGLSRTGNAGGETDFTVSFGAGSYNFSKGEFGYLGKKGNTWQENVGFGLGALANVSDAVAVYTAYATEKESSVELFTSRGSSTANDPNGSGGGHSGLRYVDENGKVRYVNQYPTENPKLLGRVGVKNQGNNGFFNSGHSDIDKTIVRRVDIGGIESTSLPTDYQPVICNCSDASAQALRGGGVWSARSPVMTPALLKHIVEYREVWLQLYGL